MGLVDAVEVAVIPVLLAAASVAARTRGAREAPARQAPRVPQDWEPSRSSTKCHEDVGLRRRERRGFLARKHDGLDFLEIGRGVPHGYDAFYKSVDTLLWGRKTYEVVLSFEAGPTARSASWC